jgi:polysaccharide biosynthesis transport protein
MLQPEQTPSARSFEPIAETQSATDSFHSVLEFLRRQYLIIAIATVIAVVLGIVYVITSPSSYTAVASMILDSKRIQLFQQQSLFTEMPVDTGNIDSQVEIIKSETVAKAVIKKLNLINDPEFVGGGGGFLGTLFSLGSLLSADGPRSEFALERQAVRALQSRLSVRRVGLTYVIEIGFRSTNPDRAAEIANAVADAYIDDQLESKFQAARRAGVWLQDRLRELREQASAAERAVVAYKNRNNMVDAGGRTINEQQLAELNSQLVLAQSQTAEARARLDRVQAVLKSDSPGATVSATVGDTLKNDVITKLRSQYLELARREADWTVRYGPTHLAVVNVRNQMRELQNSIRDELQRIGETYKSDYEIAKQRETSVQKQLDEAVSQSQVTNKAQVELRELESNAQTYRALYDNFLQRYMESVQQQSFPITEARVISPASRPLSPSHPRTRLILMLAAMVGLGFGAVAGAWRDFADRVFRTRRQIEDLLQVECVAMVPIVKTLARSVATRPNPEVASRNQEAVAREGSFGRGVASARNVTPLKAGQQTIESRPEIFTVLDEAPFSAFAEAIRSIKVAVDLNPAAAGGKIIGFTSSLPNEGKSSVALATAGLTAQTGAKTILVDFDLKNPSLSRLLTPRLTAGVVEVLKGQASLDKVKWIDPVTTVEFVPASTKARLAHSSEILASPQARKFFESLRSSYDYIFVDFAPLMPIVDVRVATHLVDGYVYIVEWGKTRIDYVEQALRSAKGVHEHLLGVALNKVDLKAVGKYDGRGAGYYHHGDYYQRYGYTD